MFVLLLALGLLGRQTLSAILPTIDERHTLTKRNPCDGVNGSPVLYNAYYEDSCPAPNKLNPDGTCQGQDNLKNKCVTFCQQNTTFTYHTEAPIYNSYCHGPFMCTVADTVTKTIIKSGTLNADISIVLSLGISGGFTWADATARARAFSVKLNDGECGYFTIVPVWKQTCGTITQGFDWDGNIDEDLCRPYETYQYCAEEQRRNYDQSQDSETIFVKTDCSTRAPLDMDTQDPVYQRPGVPVDRGTYAILAAGWENVGPASAFPAYTQPKCGVNNGYTMPVADVENAIQQLSGKGETDCCTANNGDCVVVVSSGGMAVDLCGDGTGKQLCTQCVLMGNYVDGIRQNCQQDGKVGGSQDIAETPGLTVAI